LRNDADPERLWRSLRKSKKSVGEVLMAQELVSLECVISTFRT